MINSPQAGNGTAENTGGSRQHQQHSKQQISPQQQTELENQISIGAGSLVGLHDLGQTTGQSHALGGSGNDMASTSPGEPTHS